MRQITLLIIALLVTVAIKSQTLRDQWVTCTPNGDTVLDPYFSEVETEVVAGYTNSDNLLIGTPILPLLVSNLTPLKVTYSKLL